MPSNNWNTEIKKAEIATWLKGERKNEINIILDFTLRTIRFVDVPDERFIYDWVRLNSDSKYKKRIELKFVKIAIEEERALRRDIEKYPNFIIDHRGSLVEYIPDEFVPEQIDAELLFDKKNWIALNDEDYCAKLYEENPEIDDPLPYDLEKYFRPHAISHCKHITWEEQPSFIWLASETNIDVSVLMSMVNRIRDEERLYFPIKKKKKDGSIRICYAPDKKLKKIQRVINRELLKYQYPEDNVFGFSGGNIIDTITPHCQAKTILSFDIKNAFPSVTSIKIKNCFLDGRIVSTCGTRNRVTKIIKNGKFSWRVSNILIDLTTYKKRLPQGAPTSPRIFDLTFSNIDKHLNQLAKNVGGVYTRYADNLYFSMPVDFIPDKIVRAVLRSISRSGKKPLERKFQYHKMRISHAERPIKMLGLNLINGEINSTRTFKRKLRLAIHHVNWLIDHDKDYADAYDKLNGLLAFARMDTLNNKLLSDIAKLEQKL
jgi:RNA-directed DNA polymerase